MKFSIDVEILQKAVATAMLCVDGSPSIPCLGCLLLKAESDILTIESFNLNMGLSLKVEAEVEEDGAVLISAKLFSHILGKLPEGDLNLFVDANYMVRMSMDDISFEVLGMSDLEFPKIPKVEVSGNEFTADELHSYLSRVSFCTSKDESRPVLGGVLFQNIENKLLAVGTDGRRLAKIEKTLDEPRDDFQGIIPNAAFSVMLKLLKSCEGELFAGITLADHYIQLNVANVTFISKQVEGVFPNFNSVIPAESDKTTTIPLPCQSLVNAVRRASTVLTKDGSVKLMIEDDCLSVISSSNANLFSEKLRGVECEKAVKLSLNPQFLLDGLLHCPPDYTLTFIDEFSPIVFKAGYWMYVIMPMRS